MAARNMTVACDSRRNCLRELVVHCQEEIIFLIMVAVAGGSS